MEIRKAAAADFETLMQIYADARAFMALHGNPTQWGDSRPTAAQIQQDIQRQKCYICMENGKIAAVFYFAVEPEPTYAHIEGGWQNNAPYGVVHRIAAASGTRGAATFCLNWAFAQCGNLRIDTHENNKPMQSLLHKLGFAPCGTIYLADGAPRLAFQKCRA